MEYTAAIHHGPIRLEISGNDGEEVKDELLTVIDFIEEHTDRFESFRQLEPLASDQIGSNDDIAGHEESGPTSSDQRDLDELSTIAERTRVDPEFLTRLFEIPDDEDEVAFLKLFQFDGGVDLLGTYRSHQQAQGTVLLLYLWKECRGVEEVQLELLDQALSYSDIEIERRDAMYAAFGDDAGNWLNSDGSVIELTTRGEHKAREIIRELEEEVAS